MAQLNRNNMEIVLSLNDKLSKNLVEVEAKFTAFAKRTQQVGRDIVQLGTSLSFVGASLTGPLILALNNSAKSIEGVGLEFTKLKNISQSFSDELSKSALPILQGFTNEVARLFEWFSALPQATKDSLVQITLLTGGIFTLGGILTTIVGKFVFLVENIIQFGVILGPVGIGIGLVVAAMWKWKEVSDVVLNTFEVLFNFLKIGFLGVSSGVQTMVANIAGALSDLFSNLSEIESPFQKVFLEISNGLAEASINARIFAEQDMIRIEESVIHLDEIIQTSQGDWARGFQELKEDIGQVIESIRGVGTTTEETSQKFAVNSEKIKDLAKKRAETEKRLALDSLSTLQASLQQMASDNKAAAVAYKILATSRAIINTAEGVTFALKEANFPLAALIAIAGAAQIATIHAQKFAQGTDTVPANLSPGEMVFPSSMASAIRRGDITVGGPGAGTFGGQITINFYDSNFSSRDESEKIIEDMGFRVERSLRLGRGI